MTQSQEIKAALVAEYPEVKFSVVKGRKNGYIGQEYVVSFDGRGMDKDTWVSIWHSANAFTDACQTVHVKDKGVIGA